MLTPEVTPRLHAQLHYNLGCVLQQQAELEQAAAQYRSAILLSRQAGDAENCASAHHNLGVVLAQQERWLAAIYHYRRAIVLQPGRVLCYCNLGTALLQQGDTAAAIQVYQQAIALPPPEDSAIRAGLYHNFAQALQKQGRLSEAIEAYRQSLAIDPQKAEVHYNLGRAFYGQGNLTQAATCFQQAVLLDPDLTVAQGDGAFVWLTLGQFEQAMQRFRQAIVPHRAFITAYCDWIEAAIADSADSADSADEFVRARIACAQFLTALLQNQPDLDKLLVQPLTCWGKVLTTYGGDAQLRYAERLYQHALQLQPQQVDLYQRLAQCLGQQQRFAAAIVVCYLALAIDPENSAIHTELAGLRQSRLPSPDESQPLQESIESLDMPQQSCGGLNCEPCLQKMTRSFEPVRLNEGIYQLSQPLSQQKLQPLFDRSIRSQVTEIAHGRVWVAPQLSLWQSCKTVAVFSAAGKLLPHLSRSYPGRLPVCSRFSVPLEGIPAQLPEPLQVNGKVAVLSSLSGSIYFHWMVDLLPRLEILQRQIDLQQIDYFLVNCYQRSFQQETLNAFGINADRIIESDRHPHVQAKQLIVPDFAGELGWMQSHTVHFLRSKFLAEDSIAASLNLDRISDLDDQRRSRKASQKSRNSYQHNSLDLSQFPSLIYLSRSDARYRRLLNEDAVLEYLRPYGFVSLTLDSLSVSQQATLFAKAQVIVAPHGSSLTNLVFCQPGTTVVELISPHYLRHYFWQISRLLNLSHYVIFGEVFSCHFLRQLMYPNPLLEDIWIDIDRLNQVMQSIFDQSPISFAASPI